MYNILQGTLDSFYKLPDEIKFSKILENLSEGVLILNQELTILYASEKTVKFTNIPPEKIVSQNLHDIFPQLTKSSFYSQIGNALKFKQDRKFNVFSSEMNYWLKGTIHYDHGILIVVVHDLNSKKEFEATNYDEKNIIENLNDAIFVIDLENRVKMWNSAAEYLYGWKKDDILGRKIDDFIPMRIEGYSSDEFKQMILGKSGWSGETFQYDRYKSLKIIHLTASPINGKNDEISGIAFSCRDITSEKQGEIELIESRNHYKKAIDNVREIIFKTDKNGTLTYINNAWEIITGFSIESSIGKNLANFSPGAETISFNTLLEESQKSGKAAFVIETKDGKTKDFLVYLSTENGRELGASGTMIDITASKVFEKELLRHVKILKSISRTSRNFLQNRNWKENLPDILSRIGSAANVDSCLISKFDDSSGNNKILFLYDWLSKDFKSSLKSFFEGSDTGFVNDLKEALKKDAIFCNSENPVCDRLNIDINKLNIDSLLVIPIRVYGKVWGAIYFENVDKNKFWIEAEIKALYTFSELLGAAIERTSYEEKIIKSKVASEKANKVKSEFLAQISHEIRTPINALLSFSSFIGGEFREKVDDDTRQSFKVIETSGKRIIKTIDLILHMSELQAGTYDFRPVNIDIYEDILNDIYLEHFHEAKKKGLSFSILPLTTDTIVNGDIFSITQIFVQLIENAIKYTKKGSISIRIFRNSVDNLVVEVKDTGIGITEDYLPRLFELFSQEDQGYTRPYDGTGLGLALVKKYCELNNAKINVESAKNNGSVFSVIFQ
ncbi:MAG: hypothetical protein SCALA702_06710 [Melioribacteraceae bacterium]|nr:MAG: hypothetical protein SCALA702_06710 [Melioribacteraceae bacterium]